MHQYTTMVLDWINVVNNVQRCRCSTNGIQRRSNVVMLSGKQPQTQATQWDLLIATPSLLSQSCPSNNYHHLPTQHPTVETIKPNSNFQSVTNSLLAQMNAINQHLLDMQQAQSKFLLTMNQAWPLLQTN